jgi:hypothetical protein
VNRFSRQTLPIVNRKHFFRNILCIESFSRKNKRTKERCSSVIHPQARSPFWLLKSASEHAHVCLLPGLSWSRAVLLPSDTHRTPVTTITAVVLPFVTYLLTLPRSFHGPKVFHLQMGTVGSSDTLVLTCQTTRCHNPEG